MFNRATRPMLGLDVSASSAKLVELSRQRSGQLVLEHCSMQALEPGSMVDGRIEKFESVANVVRDLVRACGSPTRTVAVALPVSVVISKTVVLPAGLSSSELAYQVHAQAARFIPFSLDEVSLDFQVTDPVHPPGQDTEVFIVAARRDHVSDRQALVEAAGLTAVVMDVASFAARLAISRVVLAGSAPERASMVALFEVGDQALNLQVLHKGAVLHERQQALGGARLTRMIEQDLGCSGEEAESHKRAGVWPAGIRTRVLDPFIETLAQDMARALQFFFTSTPFNRVDHILLAGGGVALPGLVEAVSRCTGSACRVVCPFEGMGLGRRLTARPPQPASAAYLRATGLALRSFHP